jgi:hypothetical protein
MPAMNSESLPPKPQPPVVVELRTTGFPIEHVEDLYQKRFKYPEAVPVLLKWLPRVDDPSLKDQIVRALSVPWARSVAAKPLVQEFRRSPDTWVLRWSIGNALSVVADDSVFDDIVELICNKAYGRAREMLAPALSRMKNPKAVEVLIDCLNDPEVAGHAVGALGKLRAKEAEPHLHRFLTHPKAWIRKEARTALNRIGYGHATQASRSQRKRRT